MPTAARNPAPTCAFCGAWAQPLYRMDAFQIVQCQGCRSSFVDPMPTEHALQHFYNGFLFQADLKNLELYTTPAIGSWLQGLRLPPGARMLDVGGGGGFMARSFEIFGHGKAWYVDLDSEACRFAREKLGLTRVLNGDVCTLADRMDEPFDLIYCRHVLEHVPNPVRMLDAMAGLLAEGGRLVLVMPNGLSREYLGYPSLLKGRVERILRANPGWSRSKVWRTFATTRIAHGMDPVRHVWALTRKALVAWAARRPDLDSAITSAPLSDPVYSVYNTARLGSNWRHRLHAFLVQQSLGRIHGGCHLVAHFHKKPAGGSP